MRISDWSSDVCSSDLKPFVYLLALAQPSRWSLASWVEDTPVTVTLDTGKRWSPDNSDSRSHGTVRLVDALAHSYNQATVRVGIQVGPKRIADLVRTLDRKRVGQGNGGSVRVELGWCRIVKKK